MPPDTRLVSPRRRQLIAASGAIAAATATQSLPALAQFNFNPNELPSIPALDEYLAGRRVQFTRMQMEIPRIADNGNSVSLKLGVLGAQPGSVKSIHLFSEKNPVPRMAVFHFTPLAARYDIESRVRLAGTQRVVALATMSDGNLYVKVAEVVVAIAACLDGA
jgi:sulfur-oxidizing protein SoxY